MKYYYRTRDRPQLPFKSTIPEERREQLINTIKKVIEQRPIETEDGDLYVSMWNGGADYFVYDEDEMNDHLAQQQGGGISQ